MEHLSFENDALELLQACFLGLRPLGFVGQQQSGQVQRIMPQEASAAQQLLLHSRPSQQKELAFAREVTPLWQEEAAAAPGGAERMAVLGGQSTPQSARPDAEAISRVIQRDARRYDQQ